MGLFSRRRRGGVGSPDLVGVPFSEASPAPRSAEDRKEAHFAVIDVETTGLSARNDRIVEVAVVRTNALGDVVDEWSTRINPQGPVGATHIHGITDADVATAPVFAEAIHEVNRRLAGTAIAAHHARFDLAFLHAEYARAGWELPNVPTFCTLEASDYFLPTLERRRLADCCWALGTPLVGAHSALGDARATAAVLAAFMQSKANYPPLPEYLRLPEEALSVIWPVGPSRAPQDWRPPAPRRPVPPPRVQRLIAEHANAEPVPPLVELLERFALVDALDEGAPRGSLAYLEKLAAVFEDGEVTAEEAADLAALAAAEQLTDADIAASNRAFVLALAHLALADGKVTRAERAELQTVSDMLGVSPSLLPSLLEHAERAREARLSAGLPDLPSDWPYGEPLRVGDKVVFTGCDDAIRTRLEQQSEQLGVRVIGNVSAKTAMLVSDGTMDGTKAAKARELGTRTVHPDLYTVLLKHLQPARPRSAAHASRASSVPRPRHVARADGSNLDSTLRPQGAYEMDPGQVRAWARANGYEVGVRGRLQSAVLDAYAAAHPS